MEEKTPEESIALLKEMGVSISSQNLTYYSFKGGITEVRHLLNAGVSPNSRSDEGSYPLIQASSKGWIDIVKLLLDKGAKIDVLDESKLDALYYSVKGGHYEVVKTLLENGANPDGVTGRALPPIGAAIEIQNKELIKLLVDYKADLSIKTDDGYSLGFATFHHSSEEIYNFIVDLGAEPISEEEKKTEPKYKKFIELLKAIYSKSAYLFLGINVFAIIIIFFVLDKKTGGGFGARIFTYLFCVILGGLIGVWASRNNSNAQEIFVNGFRRGAGTLLVISTLLLWSNNGYKPGYSPSGSPNSSGRHDCGYCGTSFSGNGWSTVGGDQFKQSSWSGYGYCSKSCAYDSQPIRWK